MAPVIKVAAVDDDRMLLDGLSTWLASVPDLRLVIAAGTVDELFATEQAPHGPTGNPHGPTGDPHGPTGDPHGPTGDPHGPTGDPHGPTGDPADVVLLDLLLADGSDPIRNVRRLTGAGRRVLVVSVVPYPDHIVATFQAGACGYLTKDHDLPALADTIRTVAYGGTAYTVELARALSKDGRPDRPRLSPQEHAILVWYASGMTLQAAARRVGVQPDTAKKYLERVKEKYRRAGRPTHTKLDLAARVREDGLLRYPVESDGS